MPQYGLPFEQLPATDMTPESAVNEQIQAGRQQIQKKFSLAWDEVNRSRKFIGRYKADNMQRELHTKAKQEMLQFDQKAEQQTAQLQNIDRLAEQGMIPNADEIKARMVYGADVAKQMYPTPGKERSIASQFGELDIYSRRLQQRIDLFKEKGTPKAPKASLLLGPLVAGVATARYAAKARKAGKVQVWDDAVPGKEDWRDATEDETAEYRLLKREQARVKKLEDELLGRSDVEQRTVQPGTKGGTFGDKVTESYKKRPTAAALRKQGTREAYDEGKQLGYWE